MASKSSDFFENGSSKQFEWVLSKYDTAIQLKADSKSSKAETLLKLDKWYQNELPKKIKSRGKEAHLTHEELVQTIKWKLARGVFRPRLKDLVQMNTPRVVMQETKKAFRALWKRNDLESAVGALSNLKGVGPAMASAVLAAGAPEVAPFMADECLLSMPEIEGIDYTMKEYLKLVDKTNKCVERLNAEGGNWTPHKVELTVWTHYVMREFKPELFDDMPSRGEVAAANDQPRVNGEDAQQNNGVSQDEADQVNGVEKESESSESEKSNSTTPEPSFQENGRSQEPGGISEDINNTASKDNGFNQVDHPVTTSPFQPLNGFSSLEPVVVPVENGDVKEVEDVTEKPSIISSQSTLAENAEPLKEKENLNEAPHVNGNSVAEPQNGVKRPFDEATSEENSESLPESKRVREEDAELTPTIELSNKESAMSVLMSPDPVNGVAAPQQAPLLTGAE